MELKTISKKQNKKILPHPSTNLVMQKYQNKPRFNGIYSRENLPDKLKEGGKCNQTGLMVECSFKN